MLVIYYDDNRNNVPSYGLKIQFLCMEAWTLKLKKRVDYILLLSIQYVPILCKQPSCCISSVYVKEVIGLEKPHD